MALSLLLNRAACWSGAAPLPLSPRRCFEFEPSEYEVSGLAMPSLTRPQPRAIFDGQHRARAAMRLLRSDAFTIDDGEAVIVSEAAISEEARGEAAAPSTSRGARSKRPTQQPLSLVAAAAATATAATSAAASSVRGGGEGTFVDFPLLVEVYPVSLEREIKELYVRRSPSERPLSAIRVPSGHSERQRIALSVLRSSR